ncbi:hypothetical protein B5872_22960 [Salmonella enterica subsp. enterica serovar Montevideo]|uniref:Uncharacterized protein n=3 Tax=Salmonella enterica TaxID=28901 RepID=A0A749VHW5_SALER|nr:hypothetical protein [Salmonella enterica]ECX3419927.1 hypothetical protein [Salmonella enterica subsp. enterica serovar Rubislaw]EDD0022140.1 hypothetical protein [Salmonella enterica subsp. enterica serovar Give]EDG1304031.1 hypothetical protein [Salmonella enterica subsp. enterica serovar Montevideo]EDU3802790.1 hypothetical protein [Salmonella enterica subsp. enterica serovar Hartford]EDW4221301.1 hypothetical protein [Salmonella enterica subsp. enterica serovar Braenderup]EEJ2455978.1
MNLLTWPERLISRLTGENEEEKTMTEPTRTQNAGIAATSDSAAVADTSAAASTAPATAYDPMQSLMAADNARVTAEHDPALTGSPDFEVLRGILAVIGYDIPRDRFESAVFLATSDTKAHG